MSNANLGFLFYKDYYSGLNLTVKEGNENELKKKLTTLTKTRSWKVTDKNDLILIDENNLEINQNGFKLNTTYPGLLIGAGYEHEIHTKEELKLGFYFDSTTGMPVLSGSAVKGALRSAFPQWEKHKDTPSEIKEGKTKLIYNWLHPEITFENIILKTAKEEVEQIEAAIFEGVYQGKRLGLYNRDIFFDAIIVNPSMYSTTKNQILGTDSITPHIQEGLSYESSMLKNPTPLPFIKVLPGITFLFQFDLKDNVLSKEKKLSLFNNILMFFGIGAKTNVGYGQFSDTPITNGLKTEDKETTEIIVDEGLGGNENIDDIPLEATIYLKKTFNNPHSATVIEITDKENIFEFKINKFDIIVSKRRDKNPNLKVGDVVKLNIGQDYDGITRLNFNIK